MGADILPAVLARQAPTFQSRLIQAQRLRTMVHLDVMDGQFVPEKSFGPKQLQAMKSTSPLEAHLMVAHPEDWLTAILALRIKRVIMAVELGAALRPLIALYRSHRIDVGLSMNPATPLSRLWPWLAHIRQVTVLGVQPGAQGRPLQNKTVARIGQIRKRYPRTIITCDGGMQPATVSQAVQAGARRIVVGSYLLKNRYDRASYRAMQRAAKQSPQ